MTPQDTNVKIFYGVRAISPPPLCVRVPHRQQSAAVRRLLSDVMATARGSSVTSEQGDSLSHSRGVAAAATSGLGRVGIDVEYICSRRNIQAILEAFLGPLDETVSPAAFYRVWTFGEAYFKAFGILPEAEILDRVFRHHSGEGLYRADHHKSPGVGVLHSKPFDDFSLTITWELDDTPNAVIHPPAPLVHPGIGAGSDVPLATALHHGN